MSLWSDMIGVGRPPSIARGDIQTKSRRLPTSRLSCCRAAGSPEGERLVLDENFFVEVVLPGGIMRKLSEEEMEAYRAPYRDPDRRLPTLVWPRELPIDDEPADVVAIVDSNA